MTIKLWEIEPKITVQDALSIPTITSTVQLTQRGIEIPPDRRIVLGSRQLGDRAGGAILYTEDSNTPGLGTVGYIDGDNISGQWFLNSDNDEFVYFLADEVLGGFAIYSYVRFYVLNV